MKNEIISSSSEKKRLLPFSFHFTTDQRSNLKFQMRSNDDPDDPCMMIYVVSKTFPVDCKFFPLHNNLFFI